MATTFSLGQIGVFYEGTTEPSNTKMIWLDTSLTPRAFKVYDTSLSDWVLLGRQEFFLCPLSDETTDLTTGTKYTFRAPFDGVIYGVRLGLTTVATGAVLLTVDINKNSASILSTKLTTDASEKTSVTATTPAVISEAFFSSDDEFSIDIDSIGDSTAGKGAKVTILCHRI